jgi:flagellar basal-body rod modification protein FlgD
MDASPVTGAGATSLTQAISGNRQLGQQEFLKLLITQLTHQDPLSPQDDKEFVAQMAQFSSVEGISNMGSSINRIQAASLVGKTVDASALESGLTKPISGVVKGVSFRSDGVHLNINDHDVLLDQVQGVRQG